MIRTFFIFALLALATFSMPASAMDAKTYLKGMAHIAKTPAQYFYSIDECALKGLIQAPVTNALTEYKHALENNPVVSDIQRPKDVTDEEIIAAKLRGIDEAISVRKKRG